MAEEKPQRSFLERMRDHAEAIAAAYLFALVIRCFFIDVYQIPTASMEPTLLGNSAPPENGRGDRIMATKFFYGLRAVRRYEVVIFRYPLDQAKVFIKRVAGLPGEALLIYRGNLYVRAEGGEEFVLAVREESVRDALWRPLGDADDWDGEPDRGVHLRANLLRDAADQLNDLQIQATARVPEDGRAVFAIENVYGRFRLTLSPEGNRLEGDGIEPLETDAIEAGRAVRVRFGFCDGRLFVRLDGRAEADVEVVASYADARTRASSGRVSSALWWRAEGGAEVTEARAFRNLHYVSDGAIGGTPNEALEVPEGHYVMLGDNARRSSDSRLWRTIDVVLEDGTRITCEHSDSDLPVRIDPDTGERIVGPDIYGQVWRFAEGSVRYENEERRPFVPESFILGRGFWVWLPGRGGEVRLIR